MMQLWLASREICKKLLAEGFAGKKLLKNTIEFLLRRTIGYWQYACISVLMAECMVNSGQRVGEAMVVIVISSNVRF
jgi:hypothetical protein